jgi:ABC-2 type transport system ATP-binding protein
MIEVEDLVVRYGTLTAVAGLSFTAEAGQVTVVLGPNGAGKTSTIEVLEGYRTRAGGRVQVAGLDPATQHGELVRRIGVMLQDGGVYPGIRVSEVVRLFSAFYGRSDGEALLDRVGLSARARSTWRQLSGGERQRLSLALALTGEPQVAFLDEPTSGVDVGGRRLVRDVIRELAQRGCCVLLTTHELDEAERIADRVLIVDRGKLVAAGAPADLRREGAREIRFGAPAGLDTDALGAVLGAPVTEAHPGEYVAAAEPTPQAVATLTSWLAEHDLPLADLRAGRQRLEDVFLRLTSEPDRTMTEAPAGRTRRHRRDS